MYKHLVIPSTMLRKLKKLFWSIVVLYTIYIIIFQDVGGILHTTVPLKELSCEISPIFNSNTSESLRNQISDVLDFLADFHTSIKVKVCIFVALSSKLYYSVN